jgi:alkylhydroperoxidase/carboxymuconolactone decarboxylase family protein YurZ
MEEEEVKEQLEFAKESMGFTPEIMTLIGEEAPEWFKMYRASDKAMWTDTALSAKVKVLMGMAVVAGRLCPDCVEMQMKSALHHGATKEEILDTLGVVFVTAGAPGVNVCKSAMRKLLK